MSKDHDQYDLTANIQEVIHVLDTPAGTGGKDDEPDREERETIHVYPVAGGGVLFTRTPIEEDKEPIYTQNPKNTPDPVAIRALIFSVLIPLSCIIFQLYLLFNPPIATITIIPKSQQIILNGTLQLGRQLNPLTLSQSQITQTTGRGHQDATQATGELIFYNGQATIQTIAIGTIFTGADGIEVATDQAVTIPAGNPPIYGQATVAAHALSTGSTADIAAGDINTTITIAVFVKNTQAFHGGQDERNYQTVAKSDIDTTAGALKPSLIQSMQGALQGELKNGEALQANPCTPTTTADHRVGEEATTVKVTVSETCSAIAYNAQQLETSVTQLLTAQATKKLDGYSLLGNVQVSVTAAGAQNKKVVVSFSSSGMWVYALATQEQQSIKKIIAGKTKEKAMQLLKNLPGIERVSMQMSGFGDDSRVPKDISHIHIMIFAGI